MLCKDCKYWKQDLHNQFDGGWKFGECGNNIAMDRIDDVGIKNRDLPEFRVAQDFGCIYHEEKKVNA
jgi:hypothetical protein